ncbi:hypothetical protein E1301_Tti009434 [Triplophysa tibetana]|uniref:Uncharacterized protein n=1 Tax=Triplophysa tibetana TaxID=1572043 RepID=A0A5A9P723_9TELE|nr:hypothetical protein E1301_Tti009434 [Triplophysa tibetana]
MGLIDRSMQKHWSMKLSRLSHNDSTPLMLARVLITATCSSSSPSSSTLQETHVNIQSLRLKEFHGGSPARFSCVSYAHLTPPCSPAPHNAHLRPTMLTCAPPSSPAPHHAHLGPPVLTCAPPSSPAPHHAHLGPTMLTCAPPSSPAPHHAHLRPTILTCAPPCSPAPHHACLRPTVLTCAPPCSPAPHYSHL